MASTYSTSLKIQLIGNGEQSGIWGSTTNTNWNLIEQAVAGVQTITMANANYTLTDLNGVSDEARNLVLVINGTTGGAGKQVIAPLVNKFYIISNQTSDGYSINIGGATGSVITIPNGITAQVYCNGTNFYSAQTGSAGNFNVNGALTANLDSSFTSTGALIISSGTTAQRPTAASGMIRFNSTTASFEGYDGTQWGNIGGGASAKGAVYENAQSINQNYTMTTNYNGESVGPITIASGVTVTIPSGSRWVVL